MLFSYFFSFSALSFSLSFYGLFSSAYPLNDNVQQRYFLGFLSFLCYIHSLDDLIPSLSFNQHLELMAIKVLSIAQESFPNSRCTYQTAYHTSHTHLQPFLLRPNSSFSSCLEAEVPPSNLTPKARNFAVSPDSFFYLNCYVSSTITLSIHLTNTT